MKRPKVISSSFPTSACFCHHCGVISFSPQQRLINVNDSRFSCAPTLQIWCTARQTARDDLRSHKDNLKLSLASIYCPALFFISFFLFSLQRHLKSKHEIEACRSRMPPIPPPVFNSPSFWEYFNLWNQSGWLIGIYGTRWFQVKRPVGPSLPRRPNSPFLLLLSCFCVIVSHKKNRLPSHDCVPGKFEEERHVS